MLHAAHEGRAPALVACTPPFAAEPPNKRILRIRSGERSSEEICRTCCARRKIRATSTDTAHAQAKGQNRVPSVRSGRRREFAVAPDQPGVFTRRRMSDRLRVSHRIVAKCQ